MTVRLLRSVLLGLILVTSVGFSAQGEWWLDISLTSWHSRNTYFRNNEVQRYNAENFGLGLSYEWKEWCELKGGWFDNSYERTSAYLVAHPRWDLIRNPDWMVAFGAAAGVVTGYNNTPDDLWRVQPMGIFTLTIADERRWRVIAGYIPIRILLGDGHSDVATFQIGWKL